MPNLQYNENKQNIHDYIWSKPFAIKQRSLPPKSKLSNYEKLSFLMLGCSWGILVLVVTFLHFGNSHLETKTSSTSGSHSSFYNK